MGEERQSSRPPATSASSTCPTELDESRVAFLDYREHLLSAHDGDDQGAVSFTINPASPTRAAETGPSGPSPVASELDEAALLSWSDGADASAAVPTSAHWLHSQYRHQHLQARKQLGRDSELMLLYYSVPRVDRRGNPNKIWDRCFIELLPRDITELDQNSPHRRGSISREQTHDYDDIYLSPALKVPCARPPETGSTPESGPAFDSRALEAEQSEAEIPHSLRLTLLMDDPVSQDRIFSVSLKKAWLRRSRGFFLKGQTEGREVEWGIFDEDRPFRGCNPDQKVYRWPEDVGEFGRVITLRDGQIVEGDRVWSIGITITIVVPPEAPPRLEPSKKSPRDDHVTDPPPLQSQYYIKYVEEPSGQYKRRYFCKSRGVSSWSPFLTVTLLEAKSVSFQVFNDQTGERWLTESPANSENSDMLRIPFPGFYLLYPNGKMFESSAQSMHEMSTLGSAPRSSETRVESCNVSCAVEATERENVNGQQHVPCFPQLYSLS